MKKLNKINSPSNIKTTKSFPVNEEIWKSLAENSPAHIILLDLNAKILYSNRVFQETTKEKLIGTSMYDYLPELTQKEASDCLKLVLKSTEPTTYTIPYYTKSNEVKYFEVKTSPVFTDGKISSFISYSSEITERKKAEQIMNIRTAIMKFSIHCSLDQLIQKTLDEVETLTESKIVFFHFVDDDQQTLFLQNWSTNTLKNMCKAEGKGSHYSINMAGVWVDCVKARKTVIHNDYNSLPHRKGLPEGHAPILREMVVPVFRDEKIVAVVGIGNKASNYDEAEAKIVEEIADLVWDLVDKKRIEIKLLESERRLSESQSVARLGTYEWDLSTGLWTSSKILDDIFGIDENYIRSFDGWVNIIHPDWRIRMKEYVINEVLGKHKRFDIEYQITRGNNGERVWLHGLGELLLDKDNQPKKLIGTITEITKRKEAEEALLDSKEYLDKIINSVAAPIFVKDDKHNFCLVNNAFCSMLSLPKENITGNTGIDFFTKDEFDLFVAMDKAVLMSGEENITEETLTDGTGNTRTFITRKTLYTDTQENKFIVGVIEDITERKKAEKALKKSEAFFRQMFENHSAVMLLIEPESGLIIDANKSAVEFYGYSRSNLVSMNISEINTEDPIIVKKQREKTIDKNRNLAVFPQKLANGDERIVEVYSSSIDISGNEMIFSIIHDITERKKAEEALLDSKEYLDKIINSVAAPIFVKDNKHRFCLVNDAASLLLKLPKEKIIGSTGYEYFPKNEFNIYIARDEAVFLTGKEDINEEIFTDGDGNSKTLITRKTLYTDKEGNKFLVGVIEDITERKHADDLIKKSELKWRTLFELLPVGVSILDKKGKISEFNSALAKILDITKEGLRDGIYNKRKYIHSDSTPIKREEFPSMLATKEQKNIYNVEIGVLKGNTKKIWTKVSAAPLPFLEEACVVVTTDITEQKIVENEIMEMNNQLHKLSAHLQEIREEERASLARELHDGLAQELAGLKMDAEWLIKKFVKDTNAKTKFGELLFSIDKAIKTTRTIAFEIRPIMIEDLGLFQSLTWKANNFYHKTGINCKLRINCDEPHFSSDKAAINIFRIFQEALTNCLKHAKATEIEAELNCNNNLFVLTIKDNGKGFNSGKNQPTKTFGLLGMHERAAILGGNIIFSSEIGKGTKIELRVPVK